MGAIWLHMPQHLADEEKRYSKNWSPQNTVIWHSPKAALNGANLENIYLFNENVH